MLWIIRKIRDWFDRSEKQGHISDEEMHRLVIQAVHRVTNQSYIYEIEYTNAIMAEFMKLNNYSMTKGDTTKAYKLCKKYTPMVIKGKFI